ncbi:hypothetical protein DLREEDagrD3_21420 [Denitratisoma sp. agr-D3]
MALASLPQWHWVGERDKIVPPFLTQNFAAGLREARVTVVAGYDHTCCWAESWARLWTSMSP